MTVVVALTAAVAVVVVARMVGVVHRRHIAHDLERLADWRRRG